HGDRQPLRQTGLERSHGGLVRLAPVVHRAHVRPGPPLSPGRQRLRLLGHFQLLPAAPGPDPASAAPRPGVGASLDPRPPRGPDGLHLTKTEARSSPRRTLAYGEPSTSRGPQVPSLAPLARTAPPLV